MPIQPALRPLRPAPALLPLVLLAAVLVLILAGQGYWKTLREQMDSLHQSIAAARAQQVALAAQLRQAEARLAAERRAASARPDHPAPAERLRRAASEVEQVASALLAALPAATTPPTAPPAPLDREWLDAELDRLAAAAIRLAPLRAGRPLPPAAAPGPPLLIGGREIRAHLEQARHALRGGDRAATGNAMAAALRQLAQYQASAGDPLHHGRALVADQAQAAALAAHLHWLRSLLEPAPWPAAGADAGATATTASLLQRLAASLRQVAATLPTTGPESLTAPAPWQPER